MGWAFWERESITRDDDKPYLERLILFRCPWFGVMLHRFLGSDDACEHDHPWGFATLVLSGGYHEQATTLRRWYGPGSLLFRRATWRHRVELGPKGRATTLVVHGPKRRSWGFFTPFGWVPWRKYSAKQHCS